MNRIKMGQCRLKNETHGWIGRLLDHISCNGKDTCLKCMNSDEQFIFLEKISISFSNHFTFTRSRNEWVKVHSLYTSLHMIRTLSIRHYWYLVCAAWPILTETAVYSHWHKYATEQADDGADHNGSDNGCDRALRGICCEGLLSSVLCCRRGN